MALKTKNLLKRVVIIACAILLILTIFGVYIWYNIPRPQGDPPVLQEELFKKPKNDFPVAGKYIFKSATELAEMIRKKEATSLEITQEFINYIRNNNYKTNAFVWLFEDEALEAARKADEKVAKGDVLGLLHGVPVSIKEQFWIKGKYSTINTAQFQNFIAPENAAIVDAWIDEGAIIIGTTNIPKMLIDLQTFGDLYPRGNNPYDTTRTCGGSTGGGAAAVASGFCPLALGGDMGGSIRVPAAFCGLYGLKPTENSMEGYGSFPELSHDKKYITMAVSGPIAANIEDIELSWKALIKPWYMSQKWLLADNNKKLKDYKIAWFDEWHFSNDKKIAAASSLKEKMNQLVVNLTKEGVAVTKEEPSNFEEMRQVHWLQAVYMVFNKQPWIIRQFIKNDFNKSIIKSSIDLSEGNERIGDLNEDKYKNIRYRRDTLSRALDRFFTKYNFLIMPVTPGPAFKHNPDHNPISVDSHEMLYWDYFHYPMCFNLTGHPALTVPLGLDHNGLPIAVQIVGPQYSEQQLIHFAKLIKHLHNGYTRPQSL